MSNEKVVKESPRVVTTAEVDETSNLVSQLEDKAKELITVISSFRGKVAPQLLMGLGKLWHKSYKKTLKLVTARVEEMKNASVHVETYTLSDILKNDTEEKPVSDVPRYEYPMMVIKSGPDPKGKSIPTKCSGCGKVVPITYTLQTHEHVKLPVDLCGDCMNRIKFVMTEVFNE